MGARCSNRAPCKGNTGWSSKRCSTVSSRPLSSPRTRVGGQELAPPTVVLEQLRDRIRSSRTTQRQPQTYQRSRRLSTGSQDSITRGVQSLQTSDTPAAQTALPAPVPPLIPNTRRLQARRKQQASGTPSLCAMWLKSLHLQSRLRSRPHAACGSEVRGTTAAPRTRWQLRPLDRAVSPVTPLGRGDVADAPSAEVIRRSETFLLAILFRTSANPGTRMQHPAARPLSSNLLRARSRCPQATPSTTARFRTALFATFLTKRDKQLLAELRRALPNCPIRNIVVTRRR